MTNVDSPVGTGICSVRSTDTGAGAGSDFSATGVFLTILPFPASTATISL